MERLLKLLKEIRPEIDFEKEKNLIGDGILESFDMVALVGELNETFGIEITFDDIEPENFNSAENMWALVQKRMAGA